MGLLFVILVLLGFVAMLCAKLPNLAFPEWPAWALWLVACIVWALPQLG